MLGNMHLVMPTLGPAEVRRILKRAHIPFTIGRHTNYNGESGVAVQVPVTDFAHISRVLNLCGDEVASRVCLVDARSRCYWYNTVTRELIRHGELFPVHDDDRQPCSFMFAGIHYRYLDGGY